jgi:hypothetical protein
VEDWLERQLDATLKVQVRYYPHTPLTTLLETEQQTGGEAAAPLLPSAGDPLEGKQETTRRRAENLGEAVPLPVELDATGRTQVLSAAERIYASGQDIQHTRHQLLRELYDLMGTLETEQAAAKGDSVEEQKFLAALAPLIEADAQLGYLAERIQRGLSDLHLHNRRGPGLAYQVPRYNVE